MPKKKLEFNSTMAEPFERLGTELSQAPPRAPSMPPGARAALRQRLLTADDRSGIVNRFSTVLGTAVALFLLGGAVLFFWLSQTPQETAVGPIVTARETATSTPLPPSPAATPVPPFPEAILDLEPGQVLQAVNALFTAAEGAVTLSAFAYDPPPHIAGGPLTLTLRWTTEEDARNWTSFVHLLDDSDRVVAQVDRPLWQNGRFQANQPITLQTGDLAPGSYRLIAGAYNATTGARLSTGAGTTTNLTTIMLTPGEEPVNSGPSGAISLLHVSKVQPAAGSVLIGATPITITVSLQIERDEIVYVTARLVEMLPDDTFRGVAETTVSVMPGSESAQLVIPATLVELPGTADLGLVIEGRSAPEGPPDLFQDTPAEVRWRYVP